MAVTTSDGMVLERCPWMAEAAEHMAAALRAIYPHSGELDGGIIWDRYRYGLDSLVFHIGTMGGGTAAQVAAMVVEEGADFAEALAWGEAQQQEREDQIRAGRAAGEGAS